VSNTIDSSYGLFAKSPVLQSDAQTPTGSSAQTSSNVETEPWRGLTKQTLVISAEAMARLHAFQSSQQAGAGGGVKGTTPRSDVPIATTPGLTRAALGLSNEPHGIDLSRHPPLISIAAPHWNDVSGLLAIPGLSTEDSNRMSSALAQATAIDQQLTNDPAVDITVRKMKLDYIRDNLVPAPFRAQADSAISNYVSHQVADLDQMTGMLTQHTLDVARSTGHTVQAQSLEKELSAQSQGTASSQQYLNRMLGVTRDQQYSSPAQADSASSQVIAGIKSIMLEAVARWPREKESGRAAVDIQVGRIEKNWSNFVASVR
jgi:hypothetical protein